MPDQTHIGLNGYAVVPLEAAESTEPNDSGGFASTITPSTACDPRPASEASQLAGSLSQQPTHVAVAANAIDQTENTEQPAAPLNDAHRVPYAPPDRVVIRDIDQQAVLWNSEIGEWMQPPQQKRSAKTEADAMVTTMLQHKAKGSWIIRRSDWSPF